MISAEVKAVFEMPKAEKVWAVLRDIGLDTSVLEANFNGYYQGRRKTDPLLWPRDIFLEWGEEQLQPIINRKLNRNYCHSTFAPMMEYCLREDIAFRRSQFSSKKPENCGDTEGKFGALPIGKEM